MFNVIHVDLLYNYVKLFQKVLTGGRLVQLQLIMEWYLDLGVDILVGSASKFDVPVGPPPQHKLSLKVSPYVADCV